MSQLPEISMRPLKGTIAPAALALIAALSGCGGGGSSSNPIARAVHLPPITKVVAVRLTSPAIRGARLPARYTCDGANISPPLAWGAVPSSVEELALFAINVTPGGSGTPSRAVEWVMAGVNPALHHLSAGETPSGAFIAQNSDGKRRYSLCPAKGQTERYEFALYALPPHVRAGPEISGVRLLHNLTGKILGGRSPARGAFTATYTRP